MIEANGHKVNAQGFRQKLMLWGQQAFRPFPWRLTSDPYKILTAEVMLHRTQASQVLPVYREFLARYPTVDSLAGASREDLQVILYSLGLRWRVDLVYEMAIELQSHFGSNVPVEKTDLLSLPGISEYIASAVRCFAWNLPEAIIDTNTVRVVGRLFGLEIRESSRRNRTFRDLIGVLVDPDDPRTYNYALLDLADAICTRKRSPRCTVCPVQPLCSYGTAMSGLASKPGQRQEHDD